MVGLSADRRDAVGLRTADRDPARNAFQPHLRVLRRKVGAHPAPAGEAAEKGEYGQRGEGVA